MKLVLNVNIMTALKSEDISDLMRMVCLLNVVGDEDYNLLQQVLPEAIELSREILSRKNVPHHLLIELNELLLKCKIVSDDTKERFEVLEIVEELKQRIEKSSYMEYLRQQRLVCDIWI